MPVPNSTVKATWVFAGRERGWTESLFAIRNVTVAPDVIDLRPVAAEALIIAQKRGLMLGQDYGIKAIRVSVERSPSGVPQIGDSILNYVGVNGVAQTSSLHPSVSIQTIFRTTSGGRRKFTFVRGAWASNVGTGGVLTLNPAWVANFNGWAGELVARGWGWVTQVPQLPKVLINGYTVSSTSQQVTLQFPAGAAIGFAGQRTVINIQGVNITSELNGKQLVDVAADGSTATTVKQFGLRPFIQPGLATFYNSVISSPVEVLPQKVVTRHAGAPLLESRGRRPNRVRT